ncbi:MAG: histidine kinase, partial [Bacteroidota bacterium]
WAFTDNNSVEYRSLAPGKYRFEVAAINGSGVESPATRAIDFSIDAPFWKKSWFWVTLLLTTITSLLIFFRQRERNLKRKFALEQRVVEAENEKLEYEKNFLDLEMRALRMQMNPHFLFNALNTIKGYYANAQLKEANSYISKFARLLRLILENADKYIPLEKEIQILKFYLDLTQNRYPGKFDYELKIGKGITVSDVAIPPMLLQPFVENSIIHGLAPLDTGGRLELCFYKEGGVLVSKVTDNGVGRAASKVNRKPLGHQSKSIQITIDRLKIINKGHSIKKAFLIEDLVDPAGDPAGTRIIIKTPFKKIW